MVDFMRTALGLAKAALESQEVPVGCVFTIDSKIVAESKNSVNETHNPTRHAEINCIDYVLDYCKANNIDYREYFKNITVYVTVEPCIMCAGALNNLNVREVVYGCANDRFGGKTVLDVSEMKPLYNICDPVFARVLELYGVEKVVAVGKFCETRAHKTVQQYLPSGSVEILYLPHPSPRTVNNNNWHQKAIKCLENLNLLQYYKTENFI